ncbi:RepB family protein, partial [Escherichia coli]|uniref:RepB family protein n=1 Tax=Escherichia coli TaxID=562 RepID=UPI00208DC1BA
NQESRLPTGSDFRRWVWITIAPFVTKRASFKEVKVFLEPKYKAMLMQMCNEDGLTQAEVLTALIKSEAQKRCM